MTRSTLSERERILSRIRTSVNAKEDDAQRRVAMQKRLYDHAAHIIPERAQQSPAALLSQFTHHLDGQAATVVHVPGLQNVAPAIATYLREHNLPARIRHGADPRLAAIDWQQASHIDRLIGPAHPDDAIGLSHALLGASETGTLYLVSGDANPTTLNFLPETHIVVISARDILGSYEAAWDRLREIYGERTLPRTVNMISGPSRTADIEQTIVMGAHGPRRLHVIVVAE